MSLSSGYRGLSLKDMLDEDAASVALRLKPGQKRYQENLGAYKKHRSESDTDHQFRGIAQPFQLVIETNPGMFKEGMGEGMKLAADRMGIAISNFLVQQVKDKQWPLESFQGADGNLCFGLTIYMLTDGEMQILEDTLHNGQEANAGVYGEEAQNGDHED